MRLRNAQIDRYSLYEFEDSTTRKLKEQLERIEREKEEERNRDLIKHRADELRRQIRTHGEDPCA